MSGLFGGLEVAKTGLYVSQQMINIAGNNISNANTKGYTRQRLSVESVEPSVISRFHAGVTVGSGAVIKDVEQIRSAYIDRQLRNQYSQQGYADTRSQEMEYVNSIINETNDDSSISAALADFYKSLSNLSGSPDSVEIRTSVQQNGIKLCETFNYYYSQLVSQQNTYNDSMKMTVDSINSDLTKIADYNRQIAAYELGGQTASELRDKRAMAVDDLSKLINISYSEDSNGELTITTGGSTLVSKTNVTLLDARPELTGAGSGETGYYEIYLTGGTSPLTYSSGQLQAYKDLRDGDTVDKIGVPYMLESLNTLAQSLASEFNTIHEKGYTIPYGSGTSQTGIDLFEVPTGGYSKITAGNISLSDEVLDNVCNIAASSNLINLSASDTQVGNNEIAQQLYELTSSNGIAGIGSFGGYLKSFIVQAGIAGATAKDLSSSEDTIVENLENRRESISGVSIDEEMVNLMACQHSYAAASRVLTVIDDMLETLVSRTGRVGL
jgi:flagellar hook-associated protein 1